jgi:hypothetical protein
MTRLVRESDSAIGDAAQSHNRGRPPIWASGLDLPLPDPTQAVIRGAEHAGANGRCPPGLRRSSCSLRRAPARLRNRSACRGRHARTGSANRRLAMIQFFEFDLHGLSLCEGVLF